MEAAVIDGGVEFKDKFAEKNGRTERAGAALKEQLKLALETSEIGSPDELELLVMEVVNCRNSYIDHSGYSAHQPTTDELRRLEELTELLPELVEETAERPGKRQYKDLTAEMPSELESEARARLRRNSTDSQSTRVPVVASSSQGDGDAAASL
eukprot:139957-Amphidinium_carterae.1